MHSLRFILIFLIFILASCAKEEKIVEVIENKEIDLQMIDAYNEGMKALENQDSFTAAKKFSEAELLYPQSKWAPRSALMAAYSYYVDGYYDDSIFEINRFLKVYPKQPKTDYGY